MPRLLIYDTECSGLDTNNDLIQEIAWALYDVPSFRLLQCYSTLINWDLDFEVSQGAFDATGLSREFTQKNGIAPNGVFFLFGKFLYDADYIAGHNSMNFDNAILRSNVIRAMPAPESEKFCRAFNAITNIDSMVDCEYPASMKSKALKYLAFEHGYILSNAHQAMADVFACAHILSKYDWERTKAIASTPLVLYHTYTDYHDTIGRELVYGAGFRWNKDNRRHEMTARKFHAESIQKKLSDYPVWCDDTPLFQPDLPINSLGAALAQQPEIIVTQSEKTVNSEEMPF
jgi:DNA polymerase III alpha subunit (gram-positive type)